jgi:RNA polymerase sigma-70 factor (ECF subfamily)
MGLSEDRLAIFSRYRTLLFSIAYRMLGSVADAEDALQDAFLRWKGTDEHEVRSERALLVTIVSRLCINRLQSARVEREEYVGQWLPEPVVTDPAADAFSIMRTDESLSLAFLVLLERLTPQERAVLLLRDVFDYDYAEIARTIGKDEANCRQILRRAREHVADMRPRFDAPVEKKEELLARFLEATASGDLNGLVALLANDVTLHADGGGKAPAIPNLVSGPDRVGRAILGGLSKLVPQTLISRKLQINGEPGIVSYLDARPFSVVTLAIAGDRIRGVYIVTNPEKLAHLAPLRVH